MLPISTIVHPTDFSDRSQYAFWLACALTRDYNARLIVLHVADVPTLAYGDAAALPMTFPSQEALLAAAQARLDALQVPQANVRAERRFEQGDAATEILRVAQEINADLIVMGTHGRTGLVRLLMGSVAEQVVRKAVCPVLTVKTPIAKPVVAPRAAMTHAVPVTTT